MGQYFNPDNRQFAISANTDTYIDKSMLLAFTNSWINRDRRFICVARPRRFGKSVDASMIAAYYSSGCDSRELFANLRIAGDSSYEEHLNRYDVVFVSMPDFVKSGKTVSTAMKDLDRCLRKELKNQYPEVNFVIDDDLSSMLWYACHATGKSFVFVVDEWDCAIRDNRPEKEQRLYLQYLTALFKDNAQISLVYMTGILPIKKFKGDQSSLNMFQEISMVNPSPIEPFMGFTEDEVQGLCDKFGKSFKDIKAYYEGYTVNGITVYNPLDVVTAMKKDSPEPTWVNSAAVDTLVDYLNSSVNGLEKAVEDLLIRNYVHVDAWKFGNDLASLTQRDHVLTALVYLGYLSYDHGSVSIPNKEIWSCFVKCIMIITGTD